MRELSQPRTHLIEYLIKHLFLVRRLRVATVHAIVRLPHVQPLERGLRLARERPRSEGGMQGKCTHREETYY